MNLIAFPDNVSRFLSGLIDLYLRGTNPLLQTSSGNIGMEAVQPDIEPLPCMIGLDYVVVYSTHEVIRH